MQALATTRDAHGARMAETRKAATSGDPPAGASRPAPALVRAVRRVLAPLVRLLLAHGVTHAYLAEQLKRVYLEVAERELARRGERATASRLSVATGLHRKDIRRLREPAPRYAPPSSVSLGARLISRWTSEPPFCDADGRPRPLPRVPAAEGGDGAHFEGLVESVSTDVRPRAVLDEWLRLGLVEVGADDRVALRQEAFVPSDGFDEKAHFLGRNVGDHLAAAAHNLRAGADQARLERSVHYQELSEASAAELHELASRLGMQALQDVNRRARELQKRDAGGEREARQRINFGLYFQSERELPDEEPDDDPS